MSSILKSYDESAQRCRYGLHDGERISTDASVADIVGAPPSFLKPIFRDGSGSLVCIWRVGVSPEAHPIVWPDSEGEYSVIASDIGQFMGLLRYGVGFIADLLMKYNYDLGETGVRTRKDYDPNEEFSGDELAAYSLYLQNEYLEQSDYPAFVDWLDAHVSKPVEPLRQLCDAIRHAPAIFMDWLDADIHDRLRH